MIILIQKGGKASWQLRDRIAKTELALLKEPCPRLSQSPTIRACCQLTPEAGLNQG
ncbi:MAG: hypothetical protein F6J87_19500 [Spirulina sp. SIO3F2]|nr:hypothetical protein [Spirulina sp. SIO3F2]